MSRYELSREALGDLQEIWSYLAHDNIAAADQLEAEIYQACEMLAENPGLGHRRPDLTDEPVFFWTVRKHYLVIYHTGTKTLKIARILHGARDVASEL